MDLLPSFPSDEDAANSPIKLINWTGVLDPKNSFMVDDWVSVEVVVYLWQDDGQDDAAADADAAFHTADCMEYYCPPRSPCILGLFEGRARSACVTYSKY